MMTVRKVLFKRCLPGLMVLFLILAVIIWLHSGFQTISPDEVYGSPQLSAEALAEKIKEKHIRSIINLRGRSPGRSWYDEEIEVSEKLHVIHYDCNLSSRFLPLAKDLQYAVRALESSPKPVLIHCEQGIDRTGLLCMIHLLLTDDDVTPENVLDHLSIWRGHLPWRQSMCMKRAFLHQYNNWLASNRQTHSGPVFRDWIFHGYVEPVLHPQEEN